MFTDNLADVAVSSEPEKIPVQGSPERKEKQVNHLTLLASIKVFPQKWQEGVGSPVDSVESRGKIEWVGRLCFYCRQAAVRLGVGLISSHTAPMAAEGMLCGRAVDHFIITNSGE